MKIGHIFLSITLCTLLQANDDLFESSLEDILGMDTELKADVGSRSGAKNLLSSAVPVDVITYEQIDKSGETSLTNVLRYFVPGFNAPETSVADGSDHIRTFTLRGMSSDQILVLVNGKRLHTSALLNVNGTIGRGSSNVDLDTIVVKSIEKIEILRDGAAAQYGSDAIAGVINIILKAAGHKNSFSVHAGKRKEGDGKKLQVDTFFSVPLKYDGFVNLSLSAQTQEKTQRAGEDLRLSPALVKTHVGVPESDNLSLVLNAELPQANNSVFYTNAILNYRDSDASAFFRPPSTESSPIYSDGFLPNINAKILDYSFTLGVNGEFDNGVFWDLSNVYGYNDIKYGVNNSMNYDLGLASPTSFDNGSLTFIQNTTNLDFKTTLNNLKLAAGLEYRHENYKISAGDEASYTQGGSQGFAGYRPENETNSDRNSYSLYLDATYNFTSDFSLEGAARYEDYSDFGDTTNVKLALAYRVIPRLLIRSSVSTGFRAPSLSQTNYSHTSSFGGLIKGTFKPDHEVSEVFGAEMLDAEKSKHLSIGLVNQVSEDLVLMLDYFYTDVDDKIMLSDNLSASTAEQTIIMDKYGVSEARFFTNAVDTKTQGVDVKINYKYIFVNNSTIKLGFWYNYNQNKVVGYNSSSSSLSVENSYEQINNLENGQPKDTIRFLTNYEIDKVNITLNLSRFGTYKQVIDDKIYKFDAKVTTDLDISYKLSKDINIAIGGNNIFDVTPNKWDGLTASSSSPFYGSNGIKQYSRYSPFGYSGAYYYIRASIKF